MGWVGWTALYAVVVCGGYEVAYRLAPRFAEGNSGVAAMGLVAAGGAFAVGVQFREVS